MGGTIGFEALGYYDRSVSHEATGEVLRIKIRRFLCLGCGVTISCLPWFCQPYRIVCNAAICAYFAGEREERQVARWLDVLASYRRRFASWVRGNVRGMSPGLLATIGARFGRPPPLRQGEAFPIKLWHQLMKACGGVCSATRQLVREFRITLFGRYCCHQRVHRANGK